MMKGQNGWVHRDFQLLHTAENIAIWYHPVDHIIYADWIGQQQEVALKQAGAQLFEILTQKKCSRILNDNTNVVGHWYHSVDWTNTQWFPQMILAGLVKFAWICSDDVFTQLSARRAIPQNDIIRVFNNYEDAIRWLKER